MNILSELTSSRAKSNIAKIKAYIGDDPERFAEIAGIVFADRSRQRWIAAWCMSDCVNDYPVLVIPYLETIVRALQQPLDQGTKRNFVRMLQVADIPEHLSFDLADICLGFIKDKTEPVAVKAFAMTVLENLLKHIPELREELVFEIERQMPYATPAIKSRGTHILKRLHVKRP